MKYKALFIAIPILYVAVALFFEWRSGGVLTHHILQNKNMPGLSNWWGLPLMAILSFVCINRVDKHISMVAPEQQQRATRIANQRFVLAFLFGVIVSVCFVHKINLFLDNVLYVLVILALFFPLYQAEFILGFVLGMTITFGAIIPTAFALVVAGISLLLHLLVFKKIAAGLRKKS